MNELEVLYMALDALTCSNQALGEYPLDTWPETMQDNEEAITALRGRLAQLQDHSEQHLNMVQGEWVDLTDDEIFDAYTSDAHENTPKSFAHAVIAAYKEKNK